MTLLQLLTLLSALSASPDYGCAREAVEIVFENPWWPFGKAPTCMGGDA